VSSSLGIQQKTVSSSHELVGADSSNLNLHHARVEECDGDRYVKQFENINLKNIPQDPKLHRKSSRWLNKVPDVMGTNITATLMVLGLVSNKGDVMPTHTFAKGLKINTE